MLTDLERAVLELESRFWKHAGVKEQAIRAELGIGPIRYYQVLARLLRDPAAHAHAPRTMTRLTRLTRSRARAREVNHDHA